MYPGRQAVQKAETHPPIYIRMECSTLFLYGVPKRESSMHVQYRTEHGRERASIEKQEIPEPPCSSLYTEADEKSR